MATGLTAPTHRDRAAAAGAQRLLTKPIEQVDLRAEVIALLGPAAVSSHL